MKSPPLACAEWNRVAASTSKWSRTANALPVPRARWWRPALAFGLTLTIAFAPLRLAAALAPVAAALDAEALPPGRKVVALEVSPATVKLDGVYDAVQLVVRARLDNGDTIDATRLASYETAAPVSAVTPSGQVNPLAAGRSHVMIRLAGQTLKLPVEVVRYDPQQKVDFIRDVNPVIAQLGCSSGGCHGAKDGKAGFKLSLRGYDPIYDVRSLVDDHAGRRVNFASPDDSLMLLKTTGAVPHEGGQRTKFDDKYYRILRAWIADGAKLDLASPRVTRIEISPRDPVLQQVGSRQQMRILATYADGRQRDVTAEGFIESGNVDVVATERGGLIRTLRRGEAPVLARYEGNYAATTVTVMGDRSGFVWQQPETWNKIDEFVAAKWQRMKILPSALCSDEEFLRRVQLDLTGLPPTAEDVRAFVADSRPTRVKRDALIERLIGGADYIDHWSNKWADLLQVNRKFLGEEGARLFRDWIRQEIATNTPYDQFARKIITAQGSNRENPASSYYKVLRTPAETMENTTHLFLATRFNCNKCHDHPFERWTQDQYYQLSAYFAQVDLKKDPEAGNKTIAGSAVEGAKPLFEITYDKTEGEMTHDRTGQITPPEFPYPAKIDPSAGKTTRREQLAAWMTSADNRYFALSYVNRMWGYLTGVGLIDPLDDIRAGNPPSNPELLAWLTQQFVQSGFDVRQLQRTICQSRTYQLAIATHKWNADDRVNYSHAIARRLPAEVLLDAVFKVTGSAPNFPGVKAGTRAAQLPDSAIDVPSGFLASLGRPARESACECERSSDIGLGSVMALLSGPAVSGAINDPKNELAQLTATTADDRKLVDEIFLRTLNRHATDKESSTAVAAWQSIGGEHARLAQTLAQREAWWAPLYAQKQDERQQAVTLAGAAVEARTRAIAPQVAAAEQKRQEKIATEESALAAYRAALPAKQPAWEKSLDDCRRGTAWTPLAVTSAKSNNNTQLTRQDDGSYFATGPAAGFQDYVITAEVKSAKITGLLLEVLPDERLPGFGPGRANGNFVLSELVLKWGDKAGRRGQKDVEFRGARADFTQKDYEVTGAINGKVDGGRDGWAIGGKVAEPHYARFAFKEPLGDAAGITLTLTLQQRFRDGFSIGRFRLWVTTSTEPLELGLPETIVAALRVPPTERVAAQLEGLAAYHLETDTGLLKRQQALAKARTPLPIDPELKALGLALATAETPVPIDAKLVQLRADAEMSTRQLADVRLTGAQDLTWALINNPAFLFNR
ncbi:DUF1549 and DUF1553 domain-containing protein [Horticoccus sp. 23ND18S-11]|uniref:DUF1549 and DUF1553 domain-containing protein n=1 Tax=Horticoccus sp. 23ND18S-11 TaxID=3391832 RepID=UPI0039C94DE2